jgi:hypothetical protein
VIILGISQNINVREFHFFSSAPGSTGPRFSTRKTPDVRGGVLSDRFRSFETQFGQTGNFFEMILRRWRFGNLHDPLSLRSCCYDDRAFLSMILLKTTTILLLSQDISAFIFGQAVQIMNGLQFAGIYRF